MGETKFKKIKNSLLLVLLVFVSLSAVSASAITSISPTEGHSSINQQPLLSWSNSVIENFDTYALTISPHSDMSNPITNKILKNTFYQTQSPLPTGKWYWQVKANGTNSANETVEEISNIFSFEIITIPQYTVVPNLSRYDEEKRVDFIMDAPLGSEVSITISKTGFTLPFTSQSLVSQTFVSFLDPGTYTIEAEFVNNGLTTSYSGNFHLEQYIIPIHKVQ